MFLNHLCDGEPQKKAGTTKGEFLNHLCDGEHEVDDCTGLVVGYADFSEMPACLRSVDSPDFDLLILQDGESHPEYVSGAYEFEVIG